MKKLTTLLFAITFFSGMALAQDNTADVTQTGNMNDAEVNQIVSNSAEVYLDQSSDGSGPSQALIDQTGGANFVSLEQSGLNSATIDQSGKHSVKGFNDQWNTSNPVAYQTNTGGAVNSMNITQESLFNQAYVNQIGTGNIMDVYQGAGNSNVARLMQDGSDNLVDVSLSGGSINRVKAEQYGDGNKAYVDVVGTGNNEFNNGSSFIYQNGNGQTADVNITGDLNYYNISQLSVGNMSVNIVNGNGNTISVTQN